MSTKQTTDTVDDVKAAHRAMWASGDYPAAAARVIPHLGAVLVDECNVRAGQRVLDIATGAGNAAIPAALAGADVVACDLTPELLTAGEQAARARGARLSWQQADAEQLPYPDAEFDVVLSCLGVMFTPRHDLSAGEMLRVCRPGGRIGLISWTPDGFIGQMLAAMKPFLPPAPAGSRPAVSWGVEGYIRDLFGEGVTDIHAQHKAVHVDTLATPEEFLELFKTGYGPMVSAYRGLAGRPDSAADLDRALIDLARRNNIGAGSLVMDWEYLLVTAARSARSAVHASTAR